MGLVTLILWIWGLSVLAVLIIGSRFILKKTYKSIKDEYKYYINFKGDFKNSNIPIIKLKIRGKYKYFLLDSGANINILSKEMLPTIMKQSDNIKVVGDKSVVGIGSNCEDPAFVISETISIGKDKYEENFTVLDNWENSRREISKLSNIQVIGILGAEFFKKSKWMIDFDKHVVWVKK